MPAATTRTRTEQRRVLLLRKAEGRNRFSLPTYASPSSHVVWPLRDDFTPSAVSLSVRKLPFHQMPLDRGSPEAVSNCAVSWAARAAARVRRLRPCRHKGSRPAPPARREYASLD